VTAALAGGPVTTIVVPTLGRPSLRVLLEALATGTEPVTGPVIVVDDRPAHAAGDDLAVPSSALPEVRVLRSGGGGPARARNLGWRHARTPWVSFLDDDVVPDPDWWARLREDLESAERAPRTVAGVQGRVRVPLPADRRPTDWERGTAGLAHARWITADLSYRRSALAAVGGFDERFPRAYREDADLGLRVTASQGAIVLGRRWVSHPVRPADDWVSVRQQAGNADDALMRRLHGRRWRQRASAPTGRRNRHLVVTAAGLVALGAALSGHRSAARFAALGWSAGTAELAWARIAPGPRDVAEVRRMMLTSAVIPAAATWHLLAGEVRHRRAGPWRGVPDLLLVDRDGTLVHDVPYNGDPTVVEPIDGVRESLDRVRALGIRIGVVSNQSGVGTGRITRDQVDAVNARVEELLGPFDLWRWCPHAPDDGCDCRKPAPGLVKDATAALGVAPDRTVLIGDIGSDVEAARAAGVAAVLVPTPATRQEEVAAAEQTAPTFAAAVDDVLAGRW
jgi:histidinol-phosphate phosphatase family protein